MPVHAKEKIFVIDDDIAITSAIDFLLNRKYVVEVTFSGQTALGILEKKTDYPVILLDIGLKDMSGLDVLKKLKGMQVPSEVIMLTANQDVDVAVDTMKAGAFDYIRKPFTFEILDSCITRALESYKMKTTVISREVIIEALKLHHGKQIDAARYLAISLDELFKKIAEFNIGPGEIV